MPKSNYESQEAYENSRRSDMSAAYDKEMKKPKPMPKKKKTSASTVGGGGVGSAAT